MKWSRALLSSLAVLAVAVLVGASAAAAGGSVRWGDVVRRGSPQGQRVALTFDDGPREPYTSQILDILRDQGVHATFFVIGENARRHAEVVRRMAREGHAVGNHSWSHRPLDGVSIRTARLEIGRTDTLLQTLTGERPFLFRPPFGRVGSVLTGRDGVVARRHHVMVLWSVQVSDWNTRSPLRVAAGTLRRVTPGSIVLLHDGGGPRDHVVTATRWMVGHLARRGLDLVTVPELLGLGRR